MANEPQARRSGFLSWFVSHPKTTIALCLLLMLILTGFIFDYSAKNRRQRQIDRIADAGEPLTLGDLEALMPDIPDEENMALIVIDLAKAMAADAQKLEPELRKLIPYVGTAYSPLPGQRLPTKELEATRIYLSEIAEELEIIHEALKLDRGCFPIKWTTPVNKVFVPEFSNFRHVSKVLAMEALVAAHDQDRESTCQVIEDMLHFDRGMQCNTQVISLLVRMGIRNLTLQLAERTINLCGMNDAYLLRLQRRLADTEGDFQLRPAIIAERVTFLDTMRWLRGTPGRTASTSLDNLYRFIPILPELDESAGLDCLTKLVHAADKPNAESIEAVKAIDTQTAKLPKYCIMSRFYIYDRARLVELWVAGIGAHRSLRVALACERYRLTSGDWPESLNDLVPGYLEALPVDPFDGKPIRYARTDEGIKVWCIAEDLTDDGGELQRLLIQKARIEKKRIDFKQTPFDRGWHLINPDRRNRPADDEEK